MNQIYELTIGSFEDIKDTLTAYVLEKRWKDVYITGAVGSVINMAFTAPRENTLPLQTVCEEVGEAAEVVAFTGEVMLREKMDPALSGVYPDMTSPLFLHIHIGCAYKGGIVRGGGMAGGQAFRSLRVFMLPLDEADDNYLLTTTDR